MVELWERQKGENKQSYTYYLIYQNEIKDGDKKPSDVVNFVKNLTKSNEKYIYQDTLITLPTINRIQGLMSRWDWRERDAAHQNYLIRLDEEGRQEQFVKDNDDIIEAIHDGLKYNKRLRRQLNHSEYAESTKINLNYTLSRELDLLNKNLRLAVGKPINISKSEQDVSLDAEVEYTGLSDLFEAFNEGKKRYNKHKEG